MCSTSTVLLLQVAELPAAHMYVGRTNLSIEDIRAWNSMHRREYELHVNDCRHYVNSLVKYTTGEFVRLPRTCANVGVL